MSSLLEMRDLLAQREGRTVFEVKSLSVERGETLAVVGPNGAGKTTLLLVIARLLKPERGQLLFDGQAVERMGAVEYRRRLALVMQEPLLINRTVADNVALGLRYRGVSASERIARVIEWLEHLGIAHLASRPAAKLSGGEARRASLARAFVLAPELLLLDEPFGGLDSPTRQRLFTDLRAILAKTGTTTVLITHQLDEALQLSDRLAVILDGRIRQIGSPPEVLANPVSDEVAQFLGGQTASH
jgi:tungstate transport system ATP-binding protein